MTTLFSLSSPLTLALTTVRGKMPRVYNEANFNVVQYRRHPRGGHFAMLEAPTLLVGDLADFIVTCRGLEAASRAASGGRSDDTTRDQTISIPGAGVVVAGAAALAFGARRLLSRL